jgi:hypothetical protein
VERENKMGLTKADLLEFTGTENWYRHSLNRNVTYTDGVKFMAESAGAYWLIDEVATGQLHPQVELNDAPEAVQEMVRQQEVTPALAISEVRQNGAAAVETLRAKATAAKAKGKKTAKMTKKANTSVINLAPAVRKLLKDIPAEDLKNPDNEWISVSRVKLVAIAGLLS